MSKLKRAGLLGALCIVGMGVVSETGYTQGGPYNVKTVTRGLGWTHVAVGEEITEWGVLPTGEIFWTTRSGGILSPQGASVNQAAVEDVVRRAGVRDVSTVARRIGEPVGQTEALERILGAGSE